MSTFKEFLKTKWGKYLSSLFYIFLCHSICVWLAIHDYLFVGCFLSVLFGILSFMFIPAADWGGGAMITGLFTIIFVCMIPCFTNQYSGNGEKISGISVADAPDHNETIFYFTDGVILEDYYGYVPLYGKTSKVGDLYVAPLVPPHWQKTDAVPAWVVSENKYNHNWDKDFRSGLRKNKSIDVEDGIKRAETKYKIKSAEDAPVISWEAVPENSLKEYKMTSRALLIFFLLVWTITFLVGENGKKSKEKRKERESDRETDSINQTQQNNPSKSKKKPRSKKS